MDILQSGYGQIGEIRHGRIWPDWGPYVVVHKETTQE